MKSAKDVELDRLDQLHLEPLDAKEGCHVEKSGERVLNDTIYHFRFTTETSKRHVELLPKVKVKLDDCKDTRVTMLMEGLNFDMPEAMSWRGLAGVRNPGASGAFRNREHQVFTRSAGAGMDQQD